MKHKRLVPIFWLVLAIVLAGCGPEPYATSFDQADTWGTGSTADVDGSVQDGVYDMYVTADNGLFWATASQDLGDGSYQVEAKAIEGPEDNGFGMLFMMNPDSNDFYLFEISSDGYVWIGRCDGGCEEDIIFLVDEGWFESDAVNQGLGQTNILRVEAAAGRFRFLINGQLVGEAADAGLTSGDIGVAVETYGLGGVRVLFDNFTFTPAGE